ncbi:MAG: sugar phosphate nucleotidyltransferase [Paludibacteraceae bacterium]
MNAMIFAAGLGTRLKPFTDNHPKALLPLAGKPLLQWQIERLHAAGITDIVVNVHHHAEQIIDYLQSQDFGCHIRISDERAALLDTGGGLRKAMHEALKAGGDAPINRDASPCVPGKVSNDSPWLVCNVDILSNIRLPKLIQSHRPEDLATLVVSQRQTQRYLLFDADQRLKGWTNIATGELRPQTLYTPLIAVNSPLISSSGNTLTSINGEQKHCSFNDSLTAVNGEKINDSLTGINGGSSFDATIQYQPLAFSGMQIVSPRLLPYMDEVAKEKGDKFSLIDLYLSLCEHHPEEVLRAYIPADYRMMDVGKTAQLKDAERFAEQLTNLN